MRTLKAAGGLLPAGTVSRATRTIFHRPPLRFRPTEGINSWTSIQYATTFYSRFWKMKVLEKDQGKLWCSILAFVQVVYAPARFWEGSARCWLKRAMVLYMPAATMAATLLLRWQQRFYSADFLCCRKLKFQYFRLTLRVAKAQFARKDQNYMSGTLVLYSSRTILAPCRRTLGSERHRYAVV